MRNYYQIFNNWDASQVEALKSAEVNVATGLQKIRLYDQERFSQLEPLFKRWGAMVTIGSEFSDDDYSSAKHLMVLPDWQTQYPQPESGFSYLQETYDLNDFCPSCGIGAVQKGPFRIQKDIKWSRKKSFILNWVLDQVFVSSDAYETIFAPIGIDFFPVLLHKSEKIIDGVRQLKIDTAVTDLRLGNATFERCEACARIKYQPITNDFFPAFTDASYAPLITRTREYYGSGKSASNWIVVSQSFRTVLLAEKINFTYHPGRPSGAN